MLHKRKTNKLKKGKRKILFAINGFNIGGAEKLIVDQLHYLNTEKYDLYLLVFFQFPERKNFYHLVPSNVKIIKLNFKNFKDILSWIELYRVLKKIKPDVVRSALFFSNTVMRMYKIIFGYKIIITEHNVHVSKTRMQIFTDKILSYLTYKIVTDSKTILDFTSRQEKIDRKKFKVIYNGIDIKETEEAKKNVVYKNLRKELGLNEEDKIILNVARLVPQKNHKLMLESFYEFYKNNKSYRLVIVGGGNLYKELTDDIQKNDMKDNIIITGTRTDIFRFYLISDFFLLTSKREGFCLAAILAMNFGLPVVSTRVAGLDEYVLDGYNGFLAKHELNDIVLKMKNIAELDEDSKKRYMKNAFKTASKYDIRNNVKQYEELFDEVIN